MGLLFKHLCRSVGRFVASVGRVVVGFSDGAVMLQFVPLNFQLYVKHKTKLTCRTNFGIWISPKIIFLLLLSRKTTVNYEYKTTGKAAGLTGTQV